MRWKGLDWRWYCSEVVERFVSLYGGRILGGCLASEGSCGVQGEIKKFGLNVEKASGKENPSCLFDFYIFLLSIQVLSARNQASIT
jgi:hypothetical protein